MKKLTPTQKKAVLWAAVATATILAAAVAWWIIRSKRKHSGLVVIGNVETTDMNTENQNQEQDLQAQFSDTSLPLGYRNNNPLNLLYTAALWKGKVANNTDHSSPRKEQFVSMAYGYRAALYQLRKYISRGTDTLATMVNMWGRGINSAEVTNYVSYVSQKSGIAPTAKISAGDREKLCKMAWAMAGFENGRLPASMDDIYAGWALL